MKKLVLTFFFSCFSLLCLAQEDKEDALAHQYYHQGQFQQAAAQFEKLFNKTKNEAYFEPYFNSLLKLKKFDEAEKLAKKLVKQHPKQAEYSIALARVYQDGGQAELAKKHYLQVISNLPADEQAIRQIANYFYSFQEYDLAISAFLQGRKQLEDPKTFTYELLSLYRFKKDKNMLVHEYLNALPEMPQLLPQAENVLSNVFEDKADYQILQSALLKKMQKEPQTEIYASLLIWQYLQQQEYEMAVRQLIAQDKRLKEDGSILFNTTSTLLENQAYPAAIKAFEYLISKGKENPYYLPAKVEMINTKFQIAIAAHSDKQALTGLASDYQAIIDEFGKNHQTLSALKKLSYLQAYHLGNLSKAEAALEGILSVPGISAKESGGIKLDLGDIYILTNQPWEAFLIYEQVAKQFENQDIGNEARYRSARLSYFQGNFTYAKSQADVLKASTSHLIANDALNLSLLISDNLQSKTDSSALKMYADAELLQFRNHSSLALAKLDSIVIVFPNHSLADDILISKSKIYLKNNAINNAVEALKELTTQQSSSIWADHGLFTLADIYEKKLGETELAKGLYQKLINDYPGSMFAAEARKRFRKLRGDNIGT